MVSGHRLAWATLRSYLTITAAGFVVVGGLGAIWSYRPNVVDQASAYDFVGAEALGVLAKADVATEPVPAWAQRLLADLTPPEMGEPALMLARADMRNLPVPVMPGDLARSQRVQSVSLWLPDLPSAAARAERAQIAQALSLNDKPSGRGALAQAPHFQMAMQLLPEAVDYQSALPPLVDVDALAGQAAQDWQEEFALGSTPIADAIARETQKIIEVQRGDTLFGLLVDAGLSRTEATDVVGAIDDVFLPRNLRAGQEITLNLATSLDRTNDADAKLVSLTFEPSTVTDVTLSRSDQGQLIAKAIDKPLVERRVRAAATIDSSLFGAALEAGLPAPIVSSLIKTFSFDIDFQRDIQPGDSFEVLYDRVETEEGEFAKAGNILFAALTLSGNTIPVYFYERDGVGEYFSATGETVRKTLLRTPIDGARITSGFGMRLHPLLGYSKMHKGVDFGAPTGTPIFAAGNGTIVDIERHRDYGNYIRIRHSGQYQTAYAHMSRFAKGLKKGDKVHQGDVIGYVGSTGRATGPHLHYEVLVGGEPINPAKLKNTGGDKLVGKELKAFKDYVASIDSERVRQAQQQLIAERIPAGEAICDDAIGCQN